MVAYGLRELDSVGLRQAMGYRVYANGTPGEGTNVAGSIKTTVAMPFIIDGIWKTPKAATDDITWGTAATSGEELLDLPDGETAYYTFSLNASGAVKCAGPNADNTAQTIHAPLEDTAVFAILKIVNSSGAVFNPGTTDLSAAGITDTWTSVSILPVVETV